MRKKILFSLLPFAALVLAAGCASMEEAYYLDREFGQASQASFDQQILYPDYRYAGEVPEGAPGIIAEEVMAVHIDTYKTAPTKSDVFELGVTQ